MRDSSPTRNARETPSSRISSAMCSSATGTSPTAGSDCSSRASTACDDERPTRRVLRSAALIAQRAGPRAHQRLLAPPSVLAQARAAQQLGRLTSQLGVVRRLSRRPLEGGIHPAPPPQRPLLLARIRRREQREVVHGKLGGPPPEAAVAVCVIPAGPRLLPVDERHDPPAEHEPTSPFSERNPVHAVRTVVDGHGFISWKAAPQRDSCEHPIRFKPTFAAARNDHTRVAEVVKTR